MSRKYLSIAFLFSTFLVAMESEQPLKKITKDNITFNVYDDPDNAFNKLVYFSKESVEFINNSSADIKEKAKTLFRRKYEEVKKAARNE